MTDKQVRLFTAMALMVGIKEDFCDRDARCAARAYLNWLQWEVPL